MTSTRAFARAIVIATLIAVAVILVIVAAGWTPRVEYVVALAVVGAVATVTLRRLTGSVAGPTWPPVDLPRREAAGVDPRIATIESSLHRSVEDAGVARRRLQPLLFDLATHRLSHHRGVELVEEPDEARALLGDGPFHVLTDVVDAPLTTASIQQTVVAIERL